MRANILLATGVGWMMISLSVLATQGSSSNLPPPVKMSAEQDHERMMGLLHITTLRGGADPHPNAANPPDYDESKANPFPKLPDPLLSNDGKKVTSARM